MNSFYGGKEGRSYAIVKSFDSVANMVSSFQKGAGYTEVNYGEYVIIDTVGQNPSPSTNLDDPDNGKIYRRGIDYTNQETGGAIYIGQIRGPRGKMSPITLMDMESFENIDTGKVIIDGGASTITQPSNSVSITENGSTKTIQIGYKNYADNESGLNMQSAIGIDIPKPVVRVSAIVVEPNDAATYNHVGIQGGDANTDKVDFSNPIHVHSLSSSVSNQGVQYYDYQIAIPKSISNISIGKNSSNYDKLQLKYDTVQRGRPVTVTAPLENVQVVDGLRTSDTSDVYEYHLSGEENWRFLGNPNGQFHVYAHYTTDDSGNPFNSSSDVIDFLNTKFKWGIRINTGQDKMDLKQAGWIISANASSTSSLYAFDYRDSNNGQPISIAALASTTDPSVNLKGWFQIQNFESSFANDPQDVVLIGEQVDSNSYDPDYGTVSPQERADLKDRGIWFKSEDTEEKWWV